MAAELAGDEGIQVESVLTNDDVAVEDSLYTAGRRGVGVTVLVEKIAGAKAEAGGTLAEVAADRTEGERSGTELRRRADILCDARRRTGRSSRSVPDEMEFGVGIHGEPGRRRDRVKPAAEIVEQMTTAILADLDPPSGANVLAFVNGLGGTPLIELYLVYNELTKQLEQHGLTATRQPRRQLHHEPRDGRRLDHAARARRRADGPVGCSGAHAGAAVGRVEGWREERAWMLARCDGGSPLRRRRSASSATI